jgi:uncharacterized protein (TIGR02118 family)
VIRLVFLLRRKPPLTLAEFQRYWREVHGPLVASFAGDVGVLRYTQAHRLEDPANERMQATRGGMEPEYDGVAELWWDSEEALAGALATDAGARAGAALRRTRGTLVPAYDGHAEVWFDRSVPRGGPEVETASRRAVEDESRFIDFKRSTLWIGKEHVFIDRS